MNFDILLIGRKLKNSKPLTRKYKTYRFKLVFNEGFLFYAEYNFRLFFILLFSKKDILLANDLDTLLPNYLASRISKSKLVYDSHELFTEVPELINRPFVQNIWLKIEKYILPKIKNCYTVNEEIANIYSSKYNIKIGVVRNIALKYQNKETDKSFAQKIKGTKKMIILQGSGINIDRGAEEAVEMMQFINNTLLFIIGTGDVISILKEKVKLLKITDKVIFKDRMPYNELMKYTEIADLGLSLDKNTNLNYIYSLPNKVFDYIQAKTPILTSNTKVVSQIIINNDIGYVTDTHNPKELALIVNHIFENNIKYNQWVDNLNKISNIYTWENESKKLIEIFKNIE